MFPSHDQVGSLFSKNVGLLERELIRLGDKTEFANDEGYEKAQTIVNEILNPMEILDTSAFDVRS